jgi:glycosyltransferase involved in cell wall biosynthesis
MADMTRPIRILELRSVRGTGGGPEKTILLGTAGTDRSRFAITVCYLCQDVDAQFDMAGKAAAAGLDYVEIAERRALDTAVWPRLRELVRSRGIDIVHAHDYKTDLIAYLLAKAEPIVPLATAHGWTGHSWRERRVYYPADRRLLARFPRVIAVSTEIKRELVAAGARPGNVDVILNGIDETRFYRRPDWRARARAQFDLAAEDLVIGSVGRLEPQKRFDLLIEAFAAIRRDRPRLKLLIAGEGSSRPLLEACIARFGLADDCRLIGQCGDVPLFHHALDLFVQSSMYEGTPNVVLEAMALGSPVVATDVGGTADLVRDGIDGTIVPPLDLPALIEGMRAAIASAGARERWAVEARRRVEQDLSFRLRMARVEAIYERLIRRSVVVEGGLRCSVPAKL